MKKITITVFFAISLVFFSCNGSVGKPSYKDLEPTVWAALDVGLSLYKGLGGAPDPEKIFNSFEKGIQKENNGALSEKQLGIIKSQIEAFCKLPWSSDKEAAETAYKKLPVAIYGTQAFQELMAGGAPGTEKPANKENETPSVTTNNAVQEQPINQQALGIRLTTYSGQTSKTPDDFITCIRFSTNNQIEMWDEEIMSDGSDKKNLKSGKYSITNDNGIDFLTITWSSGTSEKFLYLANNELNDLYLYNSDSGPYFGRLGRFSMSRGFAAFGSEDWIKASSSFQETIGGKTVVYSPEKLGRNIGECWVPVEKTNAKLTLSISPRVQMTGENIYISSGFVSFSKPHLYNENSRIKKIRLYDSSGNSKIVELKDTPHFQPVSINGIGSTGQNDNTSVLTIEILEVYQGSKYPDTCLNSIYWVGNQ